MMFLSQFFIDYFSVRLYISIQMKFDLTILYYAVHVKKHCTLAKNICGLQILYTVCT